MATIKDIAERSGVSITTVSRVLNYDKSLSISSVKRKLILEVAEALEYKTPRNRVNKRKKKSSDLTHMGMLHFLSIEEELEDPYYIAIRLGIEKVCLDKNIQLTKIYIDSANYTEAIMKQLDGLIVIGKLAFEEIEKIEKSCKKIVFVDASPKESDYDSVVINTEETVRSTLNYLLELGFRDIGYLGGKEVLSDYNTVLGETRKQIFVEVLSEHKLLNEAWVFVDKFTHESGYLMMKKALALDVLPEVFFAANDNIAIGAMKALFEADIKVPDEVSLIGLNDIPTAQYTTPPLTTVKIYSEFMGECAVDLLLEQINGREINKKVTIPTKLINRKTLKYV